MARFILSHVDGILDFVTQGMCLEFNFMQKILNIGSDTLDKGNVLKNSA